MHIHQLTLSHFRSHKHTQVQAENGPIALFGRNGAGKTNIIEAISLLSPGRGLRRASTAELSKSPDNIGWKLNAEVISDVNSNLIETSWTNTSSRNVKINGKLARQNDLAKLFRVVWLLPSMDRLWIEGADGRRKFLDRLTLSFFPKHADSVLNYDKAMRERNRLLREKITDSSWYKALERQMAQNGLLIQLNRIATLKKICTAQDKSTTMFPVAELSLLQTDNYIPTDEDEFIDALSENRHLDIMAGRTLIGPHRSDMKAIYKEKGIAVLPRFTDEGDFFTFADAEKNFSNTSVWEENTQEGDLLIFPANLRHMTYNTGHRWSLAGDVLLTNLDLNKEGGLTHPRYWKQF